MKNGLTILLMSVALATSTAALAGEGCPHATDGTCSGHADAGGTCDGIKGGCIWTDTKADFALADEGDALKLAAVVNGCAGKRAAFQQKLADELVRDAAGGGCQQCPFSVQGLTFKAENTDLGATVKVTGPADKRAEFKTRYEKKIAERKATAAAPAAAPAPTAGGCGCGKEKATFGE